MDCILTTVWAVIETNDDWDETMALDSLHATAEGAAHRVEVLEHATDDMWPGTERFIQQHAVKA